MHMCYDLHVHVRVDLFFLSCLGHILILLTSMQAKLAGLLAFGDSPVSAFHRRIGIANTYCCVRLCMCSGVLN